MPREVRPSPEALFAISHKFASTSEECARLCCELDETIAELERMPVHWAREVYLECMTWHSNIHDFVKLLTGIRQILRSIADDIERSERLREISD